MHALNYFSGVPRILVPDNIRTGVSRACRYAPALFNPHLQGLPALRTWELCRRAPISERQRPRFEVGVQVVETLDPCRLTPPEVFRVGGSEYAIRELARADEPATVPKREGSVPVCFAAVENVSFATVAAETVRKSSGPRHASTSTTTSPSTPTSTAALHAVKNAWKVRAEPNHHRDLQRDSG